MTQTDALLLATQAAGLLTAAEFVVAMRAYFRRNREQRANRVMASVALGVVALHVYCIVMAADVPLGVLGAALVGFAVANALFWSAVAAHGRDRPGVVFGGAIPARLVTGGPYQLIRHPFYLAYVVGFLAASAVGGWWAQYVTTASLFLAYNVAASDEEGALARCPIHGERYTLYLRKTWRWCPLVW